MFDIKDIEPGKSYACKFRTEQILDEFGRIPGLSDVPLKGLSMYESWGAITTRDSEKELVEVIDQYELILSNITSSTTMLKEADKEMREMAQEEFNDAIAVLKTWMFQQETCINTLDCIISTLAQHEPTAFE